MITPKEAGDVGNCQPLLPERRVTMESSLCYAGRPTPAKHLVKRAAVLYGYVA
jgi:hypothetical protein